MNLECAVCSLYWPLSRVTVFTQQFVSDVHNVCLPTEKGWRQVWALSSSLSLNKGASCCHTQQGSECLYRNQHTGQVGHKTRVTILGIINSLYPDSSSWETHEWSRKSFTVQWGGKLSHNMGQSLAVLHWSRQWKQETSATGRRYWGYSSCQQGNKYKPIRGGLG